MASSTLSGVNSVIFYWQIILHYSGDAEHPYVFAVINSCVNVGVTMIALLLIDTAGRKRLLSTGTGAMSVSMGVIGVGFIIWREPHRVPSRHGLEAAYPRDDHRGGDNVRAMWPPMLRARSLHLGGLLTSKYSQQDCELQD